MIRYSPFLRYWLAPLAVSALIGVATADVMVFFDDFDGGQSTSSGVTASLTGETTTVLVQGFDTLGPSGGEFTGSFLRNTSGGSPTGTPGSPTILTLNGLPAHTSVNLGFLLAALDTWDGSGSGASAPDFFNVTVDGTEVFETSFAHQSGFSSTVYSPPSGGVISEFVNRFNSSTRDAAYNMALEPALMNIPHTSSSLQVSFFADGAGWQAGQTGFGGLIDSDESWAIDNLRVSITAVPEPSSFIFLGFVSIGAAATRWTLTRRSLSSGKLESGSETLG